MAYMNQEKKAIIAAALKKVVPAGWKYSLAVRNYSTIVMTIKAAPVDLVAEAQALTDQSLRGHFDVNPYYPQNAFDNSLPTIRKILAALNTGNHNNSDIQTDYFDVGHYVGLGVGSWDKPFEVK